jgi:hypothetical protein
MTKVTKIKNGWRGTKKREPMEKSKQNIKRFIFYAWVSKKQISA